MSPLLDGGSVEIRRNAEIGGNSGLINSEAGCEAVPVCKALTIRWRWRHGCTTRKGSTNGEPKEPHDLDRQPRITSRLRRS